MPDQATEATTKAKRPPSRRATLEEREDFVADQDVVTLKFLGHAGDDAFVYVGYDYDATRFSAAKGQTFECSAAMARNLMRDEAVAVPNPANPAETIMHHRFEIVKGK